MQIYYLYALIGPARLKRLAGFVSLLVALGTFWLICLPWYVDAVFAVFALWLAIRGKMAELALTGISLLIAMALAVVFYQHGFKQEESRTFYRPDDKYWGGPRPNTYKPDVDVLFPMPHGDLASSGVLPRALRQPRTVRFKTDHLGWRNDADYAAQRVVVTGDSFTAGSDNSQEHILANVLTTEFSLPTYSVAFPGTPQDYFDMCRNFLRITGAKPDIHMFVFEGNDFTGADCSLSIGLVSPPPYFALKFAAAHKLGKHAALLPFLVNFWAQVDMVLFNHPAESLLLSKANGQRLAFLASYIQATGCPTLAPIITNAYPEVLERLKAVYFVPTKYRVYAPLLDGGAPAPVTEPAAGLVSLRAFFGQRHIPVVDLTPAVRQAAREALREGRLVYWADDSHWNVEAIRVAARSLAQMQGH